MNAHKTTASAAAILAVTSAPDTLAVSLDRDNAIMLVGNQFVRRGVVVCALVRTERRAELAGRLGAAETVIGDLADPGSLRRAVAGMDGVFHVLPAFAAREAELGVAMVEAATASGVRKLVYSWVIHPSISAMGNHAGKQPVEEALLRGVGRGVGRLPGCGRSRGHSHDR